MGFSQGACLTLEFAARHARRYAAVVAFTGGLIGPSGTARHYAGAFAARQRSSAPAMSIRMCRSERVHESTAVLRRMSAIVDERIYPRMGHTINADELAAADALLTGATPDQPGGHSPAYLQPCMSWRARRWILRLFDCRVARVIADASVHSRATRLRRSSA